MATAPILRALPTQPSDTPFPNDNWLEGRLPAGVDLDEVIERAFDEEGRLARTFAVLVVHGGRIVAERYAGALEHFERPAEPVTADTPLLSWSMAKSMLHATVGLLVGEERLNLRADALRVEWRKATDPRRAITLQDLLEMRDGLDFTEDYLDDRVSDVIAMLFGEGRDDVAGFAANRGLAAAPGARFNYSSGTSNIISALVAQDVGQHTPYETFLNERLFGPLGMRSARATFDAAGTWVASSYVYATARDFARFGLLYLRDGLWDGQRLLPEGWVNHGRTVRSVDPTDGALYGAHWWVVDDGLGTFCALGYEGQSITLCPALDLIVVRLGKTDATSKAELAAFARTEGQAPS
jgi:CubicO group peptidase (beta-lactamase class C family)